MSNRPHVSSAHAVVSVAVPPTTTFGRNRFIGICGEPCVCRVSFRASSELAFANRMGNPSLKHAHACGAYRFSVARAGSKKLSLPKYPESNRFTTWRSTQDMPEVHITAPSARMETSRAPLQILLFSESFSVVPFVSTLLAMEPPFWLVIRATVLLVRNPAPSAPVPATVRATATATLPGKAIPVPRADWPTATGSAPCPSHRTSRTRLPRIAENHSAASSPSSPAVPTQSHTRTCLRGKGFSVSSGIFKSLI
mmetsp:Transcript_9059/g.30195  ORF Transcript_9059/g.30195 Transcript_9059/m.30195 type:complete len:253 (+) Transcript_9059:635-1393(+)